MKTARSNAWYGWRPDLPDHRDRMFVPRPRLMPAHVDRRDHLPDAWDQKSIGSCTGHGTAACIAFLHPTFMPSRLALYYNGRALEGTVRQDAGAEIRDVVKQTVKLGAAPESDWPYVVTKFAQRPPAKAFSDALKHKVTSYHRVAINLTTMRACLAEGFPFTFGFTVFESFESNAVAHTGVMPMPKKGEQVMGGHCVAAVGYDDHKAQLIVRNSWGVDWGDRGHFYMPYEFAADSNYCDDAWTLRAEG